MIGPARDDQRDGRGDGQQHRQLGRAALDRGRLAFLAGADVAADGRQDGGADRGADERQRKLVQAVGLAEIDEAALGQAGREISVEEAG